MRCHNHIRHGDQPGQQLIVHDVPGPVLKEHVRFFLIHVQACRADLSGLDTFQQRFCVNQAAPGRIDQYHALLHLLNRHCVYHMPGLFRQRAVERNNIASFQQFVQRNIVNPAVLCRIQVICNHLHPETPADIDEYPPDLSGADHAHRLPMKIKPGQPVQ